LEVFDEKFEIMCLTGCVLFFGTQGKKYLLPDNIACNVNILCIMGWIFFTHM